MTDYKIVKAIHNGVEYSIGGILNPKFIEYIVVGGGGGGLAGNANNGGGGGGAVCTGYKLITDNSYCVIIGCGGTGNITKTGQSEEATDGTASCFGDIIIANGGCKGNGFTGGTSGSGCLGGTNTSGCWCYGGGGGGGASTAAASDKKATEGGYGICGYGGGGGGGYPCAFHITSGHDGGGNGMYGGTSGGDATNYGGGGGGGGCVAYDIFPRGGNGCQGLIKVCYKTDGSCGFSCATGGTVTTEGDYTVHTFTADGTFCIVS